MGQPHSFAWSPDGSRIAYVLGNAAFVYAPNAIGNIAPSAIWTVAASGGPPVPLTDAAALNTSPAWLPDGRSLLFVSSRDGSRDVYRVAIDRSGKPTGAPARLTTGLQVHTIDVSRDGRQLAYDDFTEYANVATLPIPVAGPVSAAGAEPLTSGHQSIEGMAVSPDGRWLAFDSDRGGHQGIFLMPRTGGEPELLSPDSGDAFMPSWSPDGREVAYYGFRAGHRRLFVIPAIGGTPSPVVSDSGNQRFPDWSPDGRRLVYHSDRTGRFELYAVEREAGGRWKAPRQLTTEGGQDARWSPDGGEIAYLRNGGLWVIEPDGGAPRLLVDSRDPAVRPVPLLAQWSARGTHRVLQGAGWGGPGEPLVGPGRRRRAQAPRAVRRCSAAIPARRIRGGWPAVLLHARRARERHLADGPRPPILRVAPPKRAPGALIRPGGQPVLNAASCNHPSASERLSVHQVALPDRDPQGEGRVEARPVGGISRSGHTVLLHPRVSIVTGITGRFGRC